jgi:hypothetical protein
MADFRRKAVGARIELMPEHEAAADARAKGHHEKARVLTPVAVQLLAERGRGRVVLDSNRAPQAFGQLFADGHALEAGYVGQAPAAPLRVDLARDGDAHRVWLGRQCQHGIRDRVEHVLGAGIEPGRRGRRSHDLTALDDARLDGRASEIDSYQHPE